ncbi:MAG TPA: GNAT family N-acetyltransferase, partial [Gemmatimonadaceae bacterium]|nr:GNAT family N-acetyltransferase [Gemmatimonadaceae bacterium]
TEFARHTHHAAYRDVVVRQFGSWEEARQDEFFAASWQATPHEIILADGVPVGYCAIEERDDGIHLRELVIRPEAQGQGIGSTLVRQLQATARERAVPIRLGTFHANRAQELYARLGFRSIGKSPTHVFLEWSPTDLMTPWPFEDAPNTATITTVHVLDRTRPVLLVTHDADDGAWQFLCGTTNDSDDARIVGLETILEIDSRLAELADLPLGWRAWRDGPGQPWRRSATPPEDS